MELTRDKRELGIGNITLTHIAAYTAATVDAMEQMEITVPGIKQKYLDADESDWRPEGKLEMARRR